MRHASTGSVIPCTQNEKHQKLILDYVNVLKTEAYKLGTHATHAAAISPARRAAD
jgi:hypothetical protein